MIAEGKKGAMNAQAAEKHSGHLQCDESPVGNTHTRARTHSPTHPHTYTHSHINPKVAGFVITAHSCAPVLLYCLIECIQ